MTMSDAVSAYYVRHGQYLFDEYRAIDAPYRREFLDALYERGSRLAEARPYRLCFSDDYDRGCGMADGISESGGSSWDCPDHGGNVPNRPSCFCALDFGAPWERLREEARAATEAWVADWEREHGSRFVTDEEAIAVLADLVRNRRRIQRLVRREFRRSPRPRYGGRD